MTHATIQRIPDFERLVEVHQRNVWRYLRAIGCQPNEADDLTQETFLAVLRKPFHDYNDVATAAYLRKVAYHRLVSACRRKKRLPLTTLTDPEQVDTTWMGWQMDDRNDEILDVLKECLSQLPGRSLAALEMRFRDGLSRKQMARELSISENGVKNLLQRAKTRLRESVERRLSTGSKRRKLDTTAKARLP